MHFCCFYFLTNINKYHSKVRLISEKPIESIKLKRCKNGRDHTALLNNEVIINGHNKNWFIFQVNRNILHDDENIPG